MRVSVSHIVELEPETVETVFMARLRALACGWYIAESKKQNGVIVLCHDSEPHPHNGHIYREDEEPLGDPGLRVESAAAILIAALRSS